MTCATSINEPVDTNPANNLNGRVYIIHAALSFHETCTQHPNNKTCRQDVTNNVVTLCNAATDQPTCSFDLNEITVTDTCLMSNNIQLTVTYTCVGNDNHTCTFNLRAFLTYATFKILNIFFLFQRILVLLLLTIIVERWLLQWHAKILTDRNFDVWHHNSNIGNSNSSPNNNSSTNTTNNGSNNSTNSTIGNLKTTLQ